MAEIEQTTIRTGPSGWLMLSRLAGVVFGGIQALILLRIFLLLLAANQANDIVKTIMNASAVLVDPFRGIFSLSAVSTGTGSVFDVAAVVALVGWTLIEFLVLAILRIGDRRTEVDV
jgi:hypothetical protein